MSSDAATVAPPTTPAGSTVRIWLLAAVVYGGALVTAPPAAVLWAASALALLGLLRHRLPGAARLTGLLVAAAALAGGLAGAQLDLLDRGPLADLARGGGEAELVAEVAGERRTDPGGARVVVRVRQVDGRATRSNGLLRLPDEPDEPDEHETLPVGTRLALRATARPLGDDPDDAFEGWLRRRHVGVELTPVGSLRPLGRPGWLWDSTSSVRARLRESAVAVLPHREAALLVGLVTGDESLQSEQQRDDLKQAGLAHLTAVSGSNVALVVAGTLMCAAAAGAGFRARWLLAALAVAWFVVLVRFEPSVLRAAAMTGLVVAARLSGRGVDARHALPAGVLVLVLVDPLLAGQLGFALSVTATAGVLLVGPWLAARLHGPRRVRVLLGASVGAQLGVAPVLVLAGEAPSWSWLAANVVAVPAAGVASVVGVVVAVLAQLSVGVAGVLAVLAWPALAVIELAARMAAPPAGTMAVVVLAVVATLVVPPRVRGVALVAGAALVVVPIGVRLVPRDVPPPDGLRLVALDVGQGDALLVEAPGDDRRPVARMLVDAGDEDADAAAALRARGVGHLDAVAVTHPHADHDGGLTDVLETLVVGTLLVTAATTTDAGFAPHRRVADGQGTAIVELSAGQRFALGSATVAALGPPPGMSAENPNDTSLVLRVDSDDGSILLTGDVEEAAQRRLLADPAALRVDVLKVPHHGGDTNAPGFLAAVDADAAVISVGDDNGYGHPHPRVLDELGDTPVWRTDEHGEVALTVADGVVTVGS